MVVDAVKQGASHLIKAVRDNSCFGATGEALTDMQPAQHMSCALYSVCAATTRVTYTRVTYTYMTSMIDELNMACCAWHAM